jgi:hypothetical protein
MGTTSVSNTPAFNEPLSIASPSPSSSSDEREKKKRERKRNHMMEHIFVLEGIHDDMH